MILKFLKRLVVGLRWRLMKIIGVVYIREYFIKNKARKLRQKHPIILKNAEGFHVVFQH